MSSCWKKSVLLLVLLGLSGAALGKPAHVLFHVGKKVVHPVRHPLKSSHRVWTFLAEVF